MKSGGPSGGSIPVMVAVGVSGSGIHFIEVETAKPICVLEVAQRPPVYYDLAFTPDGARLAASADHEGLCVWDLVELKPVQRSSFVLYHLRHSQQARQQRFQHLELPTWKS